ncbi:MAG: hypothetical protein EB103_03000 [Actinobacteria bacterium]|nr:hypothetical protein [Actinomycetota bacterium]
MAKVFNDNWMRTYGFMPRLDTAVEDLVSGTVQEPNLTQVTMNSTVQDALATGASIMVVFDNNPPVRVGEVMGVVRRSNLANVNPTDLVSAHLEPKPALLGYTDTIEKAKEVMAKSDSALVLREGEVMALLTGEHFN